MDILHHEYETVIRIVIGLRTGKDQLDPDVLTLEVTHHTVKGCGTSLREVLLQILRIRSSEELFLILRKEHVHDHHAPVGILEVIVHDVVGHLRHVDAARRIQHEVDIHGEKIRALDRSDLLRCQGLLQRLIIVKFIHQEEVLFRGYERIDRQLYQMRFFSLLCYDIQAAAVFLSKITRIVGKDLIVGRDLFARSVKMKPQVDDKIVITSGFFDILLEKTFSEERLILIRRRVHKNDRVHIIQKKLRNISNSIIFKTLHNHFLLSLLA